MTHVESRQFKKFIKNCKWQSRGIGMHWFAGLEMSRRECVVCENKFLIMSNSPKMTDSDECEKIWLITCQKYPERTVEYFTQGHGEPPNKLKKEEKQTVSGEFKNLKILNTEENTRRESNDIKQKTATRSMNESENTAQILPPNKENKLTKEIGSQKTVTPKPEESDGIDTMRKIENESTSKPDSTNTSMTPVEGSNNSLTNLKMVQSPQMNLIDDTAKRLYGYMGHLMPKEIEDDEILEPEAVLAAAKTGDTILALMRLKLEAIKVEKIIERQK